MLVFGIGIYSSYTVLFHTDFVCVVTSYTSDDSDGEVSPSVNTASEKPLALASILV